MTLDESRFAWPGLELQVAVQDISRPTDWRILTPHNVVIIHLGGRMNQLETELAGRGGSSGPATPGEVWTVPAEMPYASHAIGGTIRFAVLSIPSNGTEIERLDSAAGIHDDSLAAMVEGLIRVAARTDEMSEMQAESITHTITRHVFQKYRKGGLANSIGDNEPLTLSSAEARLLREFIFDNLAHPLALDSLAQLVGMTTHQLLVAFRASFSTTPAQYVITQRLRRAQWHLLHSQLDITSIALETGFSSHSHLTSTFNRRFDCTPQQFREKYS